MQTFTFSDGQSFKGIMTRARVGREETRDVIILRCSKQASQVMAEYDKSLRLNEALVRMHADRYPDLPESARAAHYNAWQPNDEDVDEAAFMVENRIVLTNGMREVINGDTDVYYSSRLTLRNNGMPTFVPFVPKEQRVETLPQISAATRPLAVYAEDSF